MGYFLLLYSEAELSLHFQRVRAKIRTDKMSECLHGKNMLALKVSFTTEADNTFCYVLMDFQKK